MKSKQSKKPGYNLYRTFKYVVLFRRDKVSQELQELSPGHSVWRTITPDCEPEVYHKLMENSRVELGLMPVGEEETFKYYIGSAHRLKYFKKGISTNDQCHPDFIPF